MMAFNRLWGASNMIMGWAAARFGFFGIVPQVPSKVLLQDLGVACAGLRYQWGCLVDCNPS
jgi:hypothetical protein